METLFSDFSDWDLTSLSLSGETCQRARHLKVDDQRPLVSQSVTKNPPALGQKTITDKEKTKNAAVFLVGNSMPYHPCQSPLPGNRGSKEGNAEAQGTQLWATRARPNHYSDGPKLDSVAKPTLC